MMRRMVLAAAMLLGLAAGADAQQRVVRWAASGLAVIVATGIWLIHRHNGWFVGEHGTGGSEYSVALLAMLLVIAADDATRTSRPIPSSREADPT